MLKQGAGPKVVIPWTQVQAWGILPPHGRQREPVFAVLWGGTTLTWIEPEQATLPVAQDDARSAYLDAAHALHALITVRTGQPMHFLNQ